MSTGPVRPLRWALGYARSLCWPVLPCWWPVGDACSCPAGDACTSTGKHPMIPTGRNGASTADGDVYRWWTANPEANIGLATGWESGVAVLDIDRPEALAELLGTHGPLPPGPMARTGRGQHFYFRHPARPADADSPRVVVPSRPLIPGADLRGVGGMVMLPPSLHVSGRCYTWEVSPRGLDLPAAPVWMTETREPPRPPADLGDVAVGMSAYGRTALLGVLDELAAAPEGTRNDTLNRCAHRVARLRGHVSPEAATAALLDCAAGIGLSRSEAEGTFRSGYLAGLQAVQAGPLVAA